MPPRTPRLRIACALFACALVAWAAAPASSATSSTVVGANVPSATTVGTLGCLGDAAGITQFGNVTPGSFTRTSADCVVTFGSSNDAARLLTFQGDGTGDALAKATAGAYDLNFDGAGGGNGSVPQATPGIASIYLDVLTEVDPTTGAIYAARPVNSGGWDAIHISRMLPTGALDLAWDGPGGSGNGLVTYDLEAGQNELPTGLAVQPDGKVVIAWHHSSEFRVSRFNTNGTVDTTFGTNGTTSAYVDPSDGDVRDVVLDSTGRIYLVGFRNQPAVGALAIRLRSDGAIDRSYGTNGLATASDGSALYGSVGVIQPDGKLVVAGYQWSGDMKFTFFRFTDTGALDLTFDGVSGSGNGIVPVITTPGFDASPSDVGITGDGSIIAAGSNGNNRAVVMRVNSIGVLDPTFDGPSGTGNGVVQLAQGTSPNINSLVVDADGVVTFAGAYTSGDRDQWFGRLTRLGAWDTSFDGPSGTSDGNVTIDTVPAGADAAWSIASATDGDLVSVGLEGATNTARFLRFDSSTIPDYVNASADWTVGAGGAFGMCLSTLTGTGAAITAAWTPDARCTSMGDSTSGTWWDDVPDGPADPDAQVGSLNALATDGVARFRFGLRVTNSQSPGRYLAPVTFQVVAP